MCLFYANAITLRPNTLNLALGQDGTRKYLIDFDDLNAQVQRPITYFCHS